MLLPDQEQMPGLMQMTGMKPQQQLMNPLGGNVDFNALAQQLAGPMPALPQFDFSPINLGPAVNQGGMGGEGMVPGEGNTIPDPIGIAPGGTGTNVGGARGLEGGPGTIEGNTILDQQRFDQFRNDAQQRDLNEWVFGDPFSNLGNTTGSTTDWDRVGNGSFWGAILGGLPGAAFGAGLGYLTGTNETPGGDFSAPQEEMPLEELLNWNPDFTGLDYGGITEGINLGTGSEGGGASSSGGGSQWPSHWRPMHRGTRQS